MVCYNKRGNDEGQVRVLWRLEGYSLQSRSFRYGLEYPKELFILVVMEVPFRLIFVCMAASKKGGLQFS